MFVSGLLPRKGIYVEHYNSLHTDLSFQFKDSFVMASGELPFEKFQADRVNMLGLDCWFKNKQLLSTLSILHNIQKPNQRRQKPVHHRRTRSRLRDR